MRIMVSACLVGENCKYNGGNNLDSRVMAMCTENEVITVCPEVMGGLQTPRVPSEIVSGKVLNKEGIDVTRAFRNGAMMVLEIAKQVKPDLIILQSRSPSCGVKQRYDGSFSGRLIDKPGITAELLMRYGFHVVDVEDI